MPVKHLGLALSALFVFSSLAYGGSDSQRDFLAARTEYEQANRKDEAARLNYVNKLAQIIERNVKERWKTGEPNPDYVNVFEAINAELKKHATPTNADPEKLTELLIGKWQSPRHTYIFSKDHRYGMEGGKMSSFWHIHGNEIVMPGGRSTILLLNSRYLIYSDTLGVFFHLRAPE
jgi:hypothetical protein